MNTISLIREGGIFYILLLIAITMHEFGHAFIADKMGDPLPRLQGRVTVNPIAHMSLMGTVILPLVTIFITMSAGFPLIFGWGKPVQLSLPNPKTRTKVDLCSTAGGVGMNLVLALIFGIMLGVFAGLGLKDASAVAMMGISVNCVLFVINMIPIPPLDGSHFLRYLTRMSDQTYNQLASWGLLIFLVLINIPAFQAILHLSITYLSIPFVLVATLISNLF